MSHSHAHADTAKLFRHDNVAFSKGAGRTLSAFLFAIGAVCLALTVLTVLRADSDGVAGRQILSAYYTGFIATLGMSLGAMVFVMILHQTNAGWSALVRRQVENVMSMIPVCWALSIIPLLFASRIFEWMNVPAGEDPLLDHKAAYLNVPFFALRYVVYFAVWSWLAMSLSRWSKEQDASGDPVLTERMRRRSSYGLLLFAFSTAFAGFDWLMSLDAHWFSTMWGVYFFASNISAAVALSTLLLITLRRAGRLDGLFTEEHLHDMGKLMFAFCVFWAYIGFSQYFLIWYANIPEETGWFALRRQGGWMNYSMALATGRFIVPFIVLMPRPWRRKPRVVAFMALWIVFFHVLDEFWTIRPMVQNTDGSPLLFGWNDLVGILAPVCLYSAMLVRRITSGPLAPLKDPRLAESVEHKNYV